MLLLADVDEYSFANAELDLQKHIWMTSQSEFQLQNVYFVQSSICKPINK